MKNSFFIFLKALVFLIRLAFYPIKIICNVIYSQINNSIVGCAWYSKEDYHKLIESSKDRIDEIVPTFDLWKKEANSTVESFQNKGWIVFKVSIEINELEKWLLKNNLENISGNRQQYVDYRVRQFLEDAII